MGVFHICLNCTNGTKSHNTSEIFLLSTHFWPMFPFYTPWKHQNTKRFLVFSGGINWEYWLEMGQQKLGPNVFSHHFVVSQGVMKVSLGTIYFVSTQNISKK